MESHVVNTPDNILTARQINHILRQAVGDGWRLVDTAIEPASHGLSGFLGDHFRVTLHVVFGDRARKVNLFVKTLPLKNEPKAKFINEYNYFRREMLMFDLFEKMQINADELEQSWCTLAFICTERIVVMRDLLQLGYRQRPVLDCLDLPHTLLAATSIARFHAAFANYETKRNHNGTLPFSQEYAHLLKEPTFNDSPWLRAAAKLTKNFLEAFSDKYNQYPFNLEERLIRLYIEACDSLVESNSLNVVIHKDLWVNNIMFKYEGGTPVNALLIDFQCIRYGPPAFDLMIFLYLNTSRDFRDKYEATILRHYYVSFSESVEPETKERLQSLGYDFDVFVGWCHRARMFALLEAVGIFPYVLMEAGAARRTFDDADTFLQYCNVDRSEPVLAHARASAPYRHRQLDVCEEFVQRYVLQRDKSEQ